MSTEECKCQGKDEYIHNNGTQIKLSEIISMLPSSADKIKDKITEGDEIGGSQKWEDSGLRKLR